MHPYPISAPSGTRIDNYYWLRDDTRSKPEVLNYLKAENAYYAQMTAHTQAQQEALYQEIGNPATQREMLVATSPVFHADKIVKPLMVLQGRNDPRVPYTEAEQIVKAVRGNGRPVWFLMYADEGHGFKKKTNSDYFGAASMRFWEEHLLGGENK